MEDVKVSGQYKSHSLQLSPLAAGHRAHVFTLLDSSHGRTVRGFDLGYINNCSRVNLCLFLYALCKPGNL